MVVMVVTEVMQVYKMVKKRKNNSNKNIKKKSILIISLIIGLVILFNIFFFINNENSYLKKTNNTTKQELNNSIAINKEEINTTNFNQEIIDEEDNCLELKTGPIIDKETEEYMIQQLSGALKNNSVDLCNGNYSDVDECRDHFNFINAIKKNNIKQCNNIKKINELKIICEDVIKQQDCSRLKKGDIKIICEVAVSNKNNKCDSLEEKEFSNYCNQLPFTIKAVKENNKEICNENIKKSFQKDETNNINYWNKLCLSII